MARKVRESTGTRPVISISTPSPRIGVKRAWRSSIRIDHVLQIVRAAVLEQQQLLRHELPVLGDRVVLGPVLVERLVDLLQHVRDRDALADVPLALVDLRGLKPTLTEDDYYARLLPLMVELATLYEQ